MSKRRTKNHAYIIGKNGRKKKIDVHYAATHLLEPGNFHLLVPGSKNRHDLIDGGPSQADGIQTIGTEFGDSHYAVSGVSALPQSKKRYHRDKVSQHANWSSVREGLVAGFEDSLDPGMECNVCHASLTVVFRCDDCCVGLFLCDICLQNVHKHVLFHRVYQWLGRTWVPHLNLPQNVVSRSGHFCDTKYQRSIVVVDHRGRQHRTPFELCKCEPESVTLIRHHLWPASPKKPTMCFQIQFMELLRALYLQAQIPVKDFCEAFKHFYQPYVKIDDPTLQDVYKVLINESFEEYRAFMYNCEYIRSICPDYDNGTCCPACPLDNSYPAMISMDANFGLVRKKSSGSSFSLPKHAGHFFGDQDEVDLFVAGRNNQRKTTGNDCSEFKAGSSLRSNTRYHKLDETAVFGSACRHEIPVMMISLKHGERLAYPVFMIQKLLQKYEGRPLYVLYDIACMLEAHLKKSDLASFLEEIKLAIPIFHCYGHKLSCQVKYSPRRVIGLGLTDGETLERLWSYLRSFSKITKEMTASHRIDVLTDALMYYARRNIMKFGSHFQSKMSKALDTISTSESEMIPLLDQLKVTPLVVQEWVDEELVHFMDNPGRAISSRKKIIRSINKQFIERKLLLEMLKKYADGQAIAIRLQRSVSKTNKQMKKLVQIYNQKPDEPSLPTTLYYDSALQGEYVGLGEPVVTENSQIPANLKRQAIELFSVLSRAKEEKELLKKEMVNVAKYMQRQHVKLEACLSSEHLSTSQMALVISKLVSNEIEQRRFFVVCNGIATLPEPDSEFSQAVVCGDMSVITSAEELGISIEEFGGIQEEALCMEEVGEESEEELNDINDPADEYEDDYE